MSLIISSASLAAVFASPSLSSRLANSPNLSRQNRHLFSQKPCFPFHSGPPLPGAPIKGPWSYSSSHPYIPIPMVSIQVAAAWTYASRESVSGN
uniref:Secreted protein n=1 Tax=Phakopsora pachyrhizi TaxID=170000 RepID=A0A0S1MIG7_PHAPC